MQIVTKGGSTRLLQNLRDQWSRKHMKWQDKHTDYSNPLLMRGLMKALKVQNPCAHSRIAAAIIQFYICNRVKPLIPNTGLSVFNTY